MAKTEAVDADADSAAGKAELKRELNRLLTAVVGDEDCGVEAIDEALRLLTELRSKTVSVEGDSDIAVPDEFKCFISKKIMSDPVVLASGRTYDRPQITAWLNQGHRTCPRTQEVLSHTVLTPNYLVRDMIAQWCRDHGIEVPKPADPILGAITDSDRKCLNSLLEKLSSSVSDQKEAAKELRRLTKRDPSFRALLGKVLSEAIPRLIEPMRPSAAIDSHPDLQEDLVTTLLNISMHEDNKRPMVEHPSVVPLLIDSVVSGTIDTRRNAAAALFTLSAIDFNKIVIGELGALKPLIDLVDTGYPLAVKDAASAIFSLCTAAENKSKAVEAGAVRQILKNINEDVFVDELLAILALLSSQRTAVEEMVTLGAIPLLFQIIRKTGSEVNKENCVAILYDICHRDKSQLRAIGKEENVDHTLTKLSKKGTSRARRKANVIIDRLVMSSMFSHTA